MKYHATCNVIGNLLSHSAENGQNWSISKWNTFTGEHIFHRLSWWTRISPVNRLNRKGFTALMHASFLHNASPGSYPKSSKSSLYRLYNFLRCWGLSCVIWCSILSKEDLSSLLLRIVLVNSGNKVVRFCLMAMYIVSSKESSRWPMTSNFKWQ